MHCSSAVLIPDKRWPPGSQLTVWFLEGEPHWHELVKATAREWSRFGNISFNFTAEKPLSGSHIRISFNGYDGTQLGKHESLTSTEPTMRLASVSKPKLPLKYKKRIILHEFGHALGFEHEYRHPQWPYGPAWIEYQTQRCINKLGTDNNHVNGHCQTINRTLKEDDVWQFPYDDQSIMNYPVSANWLDNRPLDIKPSYSLSKLDKIAMSMSYPFEVDSSITNKSESLTRSIDATFTNHCTSEIEIRVLYSKRQSLSHRITIPPTRKSAPIGVDSNTLAFKAITQMGDIQWYSQTRSNGYLIYPQVGLETNSVNIPLYCH